MRTRPSASACRPAASISFVVFPMALSTIVGTMPSSMRDAMSFATCSMRSALATLDPPNFITTRFLLAAAAAARASAQSPAAFKMRFVRTEVTGPRSALATPTRRILSRHIASCHRGGSC